MKNIVLSSAITTVLFAGAYTQQVSSKPHIPLAVGGEANGYSIYVGGAISGIGGSVQNVQNLTSVSTGNLWLSGDYFNHVTDTYIISGGISAYNANGLFTVPESTGTETYTANNAAQEVSSMMINNTMTASSIKFGGEAHLGVYAGVSEGFGIGLEVFGVSRSSFNPTNKVVGEYVFTADDLVLSDNYTNPATIRNLSYSLPTINYEASFNIKPTNIGFGVRLIPTVMLSDQFGMFASIGYGSQKFTGNAYYNPIHNVYYSQTIIANFEYNAPAARSYSLDKTLTGINYGLGTFFNIDEKLSVSTAFEIQDFGSYDTSSSLTNTPSTKWTPSNTVTITPAAFKFSDSGDTSGYAITVDSASQITTANTVQYTGYDSNGLQITDFTSLQPQFAVYDSNVSSSPNSSISVQFHTFSVGIDYAFV